MHHVLVFAWDVSYICLSVCIMSMLMRHVFVVATDASYIYLNRCVMSMSMRNALVFAVDASYTRMYIYKWMYGHTHARISIYDRKTYIPYI